LVSAGIGSGKTLAFYLPALARVAAHVRRDAATSRWVKVLALYPRRELLKHQFVEVYGEARQLDHCLQANGRRKLLIGAFFSSNAAATAPHTKAWRAHPGGLVCEYIRCPTVSCHGKMLWAEDDRTANREPLVLHRAPRRHRKR
jgi:RAD3-like DEAD/DEAH box helicase